MTINTTDSASNDGDITLSGNIGSTSGSTIVEGALGTVTIGNTATAQLTLAGTVYNTNAATYEATSGDFIKVTNAAGQTFTSSKDAITFATGNVKISDGTFTVNSLGGAISLVGVKGTGADNVTLNANVATGTSATETIAVGDIDTEIRLVTLTAADGVTLDGDITTANTAGAGVTVTGGITLSDTDGTVVITTNVATASNDGDLSLIHI